MRTSWPPCGLTGKQEPRVHLRPWSLSTYEGGVDYERGETALDLAELASRRLPPWQSTVVREGQACTDDGQWAAFEVGVLVARQNGKNGAMEVVELDWLVNEPGIQVLHTAHRFTTVMKSMDRLIALIKANPRTAALLGRNGVRRGNGRESITLTNGSFIAFRTRTSQGGRGESFDRLVIDEAMILSPAAFAALEPMLTTADRPGATGPGGQIWYLGSAPDADEMEHCGHWASLRERAMAREEGLLWLEWSAPDPPEGATAAERDRWRANKDHWCAANPSLGYLLTEGYLAKTLRAAKSVALKAKWEIEKLSAGVWPKPEAEHEPVVPLTTWGNMAEQDVIVRGPIAVAVDMSTDLATCAIAAATYTTEDRVRVELGYHGPTADLVERIADLVDRWDPCAVVINSSSPAASITPKLKKLGIEPEITSGTQAADAAVGFVDDALAGRLSHSGDERVENAVETAEKKYVAGGKFVWNYQADAVRIQALTLARYGLLTWGLDVRPTQMPTQAADTAAESDLMSMGF